MGRVEWQLTRFQSASEGIEIPVAWVLSQMLDVLFDDQASELGLEAFLGAEDEGHHWLLVADLDGQLLTFSQLRVRASELQEVALPGQRLLLVENERCLHQLQARHGRLEQEFLPKEYVQQAIRQWVKP